jgi:hypothetical protein
MYFDPLLPCGSAHVAAAACPPGYELAAPSLEVDGSRAIIDGRPRAGRPIRAVVVAISATGELRCLPPVERMPSRIDAPPPNRIRHSEKMLAL